MHGKRLFLQWALFVSLIAVASIVAVSLGYLRYLKDDPTHITLVTLAVFFVATAWCGRQAWKLTGGHDPRDITYELGHSRYASGLCFSIGIIGTAVGYYIMLKHGGDGGDSSAVIQQSFAHASIAIVNTVFGAICAVLVEIQSHFIGHAAGKVVRASGNTAEDS